jgi:hypothetical protein
MRSQSRHILATTAGCWALRYRKMRGPAPAILGQSAIFFRYDLPAALNEGKPGQRAQNNVGCRSSFFGLRAGFAGWDVCAAGGAV